MDFHMIGKMLCSLLTSSGGRHGGSVTDSGIARRLRAALLFLRDTFDAANDDTGFILLGQLKLLAHHPQNNWHRLSDPPLRAA